MTVPYGVNVAGRGNGSTAAHPAGIPTPDPTNWPNQVVVVCCVCAVQLRACKVAVDDWPGVTAEGENASDVIRMVPVHAAGRIVTAEAADAPVMISAVATTSTRPSSELFSWFSLDRRPARRGVTRRP